MAGRNGRTPRSIAFLGELGTFSHKACLQYFGDADEAIPLPTFTPSSRRSSRAGSTTASSPWKTRFPAASTRIMICCATDLRIIGEVTIRIVRTLLAKPGTELSAIRRVLSHSPGHRGVPASFSTAPMGARGRERHGRCDQRVSASQDAGEAAIAGLIQAEIYGLAVIAEGIETNPRNYTGFIWWPNGPHRKPHGIQDRAHPVNQKRAGHPFWILAVFPNRRST